MLKTKSLVFILVFIFLSFGFYKIFNTKPKTEMAAHFNFLPDSVREVYWQLADKSFDFKRESAKFEWQPFVEPPVMQDKLMALAALKLSKMKAPRSGLEIELVFSADNRWRGVYKDGQFVWTSGPQSGMGFFLGDKWRDVFEEGEWSFTKPEWNWCEKRPLSLQVTLVGQKLGSTKLKIEDQKIGSIKFAIEEKSTHWQFQNEMMSGQNEMMSGQNETKRVEIDPTSIEKWLAQNCLLKIQHFKDLNHYSIQGAHSLSSLFKTKSSFIVKFADGTDIELKKIDGFWQINKSLAIESPQLDTALSQLLTLPMTSF